MAAPRKIHPISQQFEGVFVDDDGTELLRMGSTESAELDSSDSLVTRKEAVQRVLGDGVVFSLPMALRQNNPVELVACDECRHPRGTLFYRTRSSVGLITKEYAVWCDACRRVLCPAHSRRGADGLFRCPRCHSRRRWKDWLLWIFTKEVAES